MLWLKQHTARIQSLLDEQTEESLTFAALRCRLAIEAVCYERLRVAHEYISHDDLKRWQPREVVNKLIQEVDRYAASSFKLEVSKNPIRSDAAPLTQAEYEAEEYVELGHQVGFDAKKLGDIWHALGNFLHVRVPTSHDDAISYFGKMEDIEKKVRAALTELHVLEKGTLISNGIGAPKTVRFPCDCGATNKRRVALLEDGQTISCINPKCIEKWVVCIEGEEVGFQRRSVAVTCQACKASTMYAEQRLLVMERSKPELFRCPECGADYHLTWLLRIDMKSS